MEPLTLDEVIEIEPRIFLDSSAIDITVGAPMRAEGEVIDFKKILPCTRFLGSKENIFTIPEGVMETERIKKCSKQYSRKIKKRRRMYKRGDDDDKSLRTTQNRINTSIRDITSLLKVLRKKTLNLERFPLYQQLRDFVFELEGQFKLKERRKGKTPKYEDLRTDEKLCAAALFYACNPAVQSPTAILTRDSDHRRLIEASFDTLNLDFFKPENLPLLQGLRTNGLKVYQKLQGKYYVVSFDSQTYHPKNKRRLPIRMIRDIKRMFQKDLTPLIA